MNRLVAGALAGALATVPMTAFMMSMQRALPRRQRYALPPRQITEEAAERTRVEDELSEPDLDALAMLSHFSYGAGMGAVYAPLASRLPGPAVLKGTIFGLAVWAGSYLGLLPALGLLEPATEQPPERNELMIAAHVMYGSALGLMEERLGRGEQPQSSAAHVPRHLKADSHSEPYSALNTGH